MARTTQGHLIEVRQMEEVARGVAKVGRNPQRGDCEWEEY